MQAHLAEDTAHRFSVRVQALIHQDKTSDAETMEIAESQGKKATACSLAGSCAVNADAVRNDIIDAALGWLFLFLSLDRRLSRTHKKRI